MNRIWNKSHRNNCSLLLILLLGFILWQTPVHASEFNFAVDFELPANQIDKNKTYINVRMEPGKTQEIPYTVFNRTDKSVIVETLIHSATTNSNGVIEYGESKSKLDEIVEKSLRQAAIWDELKDRLKKSALGLSGGQQQRLCIARALAVEPEVILMDEPTSALDPISTSKIEDLALELKDKYTIIMVTHNMQQATRISDNTAFFLLGEVIEYDNTEKLFSMPKNKKTEEYITGRFG